jgi:hypothetical protein
VPPAAFDGETAEALPVEAGLADVVTLQRRRQAKLSVQDEQSLFVDTIAEYQWARDAAGRLRDDAGCQRPGWFLRNEFCLFVDVERTAPAAALRVNVTGAVQPY